MEEINRKGSRLGECWNNHFNKSYWNAAMKKCLFLFQALKMYSLIIVDISKNAYVPTINISLQKCYYCDSALVWDTVHYLNVLFNPITLAKILPINCKADCWIISSTKATKVTICHRSLFNYLEIQKIQASKKKIV